MPIMITARPRSDKGFIGSSRIKKVHTSEIKGVAYARFEIFAVPPSFSASAQVTVATAIAKSPCGKRRKGTFNLIC